MATHHLINRYYDQLIEYGGYALPRIAVINDLRNTTDDEKLIDSYIFSCKEVSEHDASLLLTEKDFESHQRILKGINDTYLEL